MKRLASALAACLFAGVIAAYAQTFTMPPPAGVTVMGCVYQTSPPTLTTTNTGFVQCNSTGSLLTTAGAISGTVTANQGTAGSSAWPVLPTPTNSTGAYTAATITAADTTILAASTAKVFLDLVNDSSTATICINFGAVATITGTACSAGEVTLPPLFHRSWEGNFVPADAIHAIASAASVAAAVGAK